MTVFLLGLDEDWVSQIDAIVQRCGHQTRVFGDSQHLVEVMRYSETDVDVVVIQIVERGASVPILRHHLGEAGWTGPVVAIRNPSEETESRLEKLLGQLGQSLA